MIVLCSLNLADVTQLNQKYSTAIQDEDTVREKLSVGSGGTELHLHGALLLRLDDSSGVVLDPLQIRSGVTGLLPQIYLSHQGNSRDPDDLPADSGVLHDVLVPHLE